MNRRGFLLAETTLKIVIAVICIGFLVYFLASLYYNNQNEKDLELAKASLEHLIDEIGVGSSEVEIYNPKGWVLSFWPYDTIKSRIVYDKEIKGDIPKSCFNVGWENCLCICDDAINFEGADCDNLGTCLESDFVVENKKIKIENPPIVLQIDKENKKIK